MRKHRDSRSSAAGGRYQKATTMLSFAPQVQAQIKLDDSRETLLEDAVPCRNPVWRKGRVVLVNEQRKGI
jgi:hypothetical protein